jgi:hypothetical protein
MDYITAKEAAEKCGIKHYENSNASIVNVEDYNSQLNEKLLINMFRICAIKLKRKKFEVEKGRSFNK